MSDVILNVFITLIFNHLYSKYPLRYCSLLLIKLAYSFLSLFIKLAKVKSAINSTLWCGQVTENYTDWGKRRITLVFVNGILTLVTQPALSIPDIPVHGIVIKYVPLYVEGKEQNLIRDQMYGGRGLSILHSCAWRSCIHTSDGEVLDQDFEQAHTINFMGANAESLRFPTASFLGGWRRGEKNIIKIKITWMLP